MIDRTLRNACRPEYDEYGFAVLERMNNSHYDLTKWGLSHVVPESADTILDIGCGGGRTINGMIERSNAVVYGIDISEASVAKTKELNEQYIASGRAFAVVGDAGKLPFDPESFDLVTAFETTYYWPDIVDCFKGVLNVLRPGGVFLVCNEDKDKSRPIVAESADELGMTLYTSTELASLFNAAGFKNVRVFDHENGNWVCAVGEK